MWFIKNVPIAKSYNGMYTSTCPSTTDNYWWLKVQLRAIWNVKCLIPRDCVSWLVHTPHSVPGSCIVYQLVLIVSTVQHTYLVSTLVSTISWLIHTPHSVPSSCTLCQPVLIVSTVQPA